jgi:O-antigen/teichoic acid export membrane protein
VFLRLAPLLSIKGNFFALNVLKLGGGTALGQIIVALSTPIITRLYSPEDMGIMGIFVAFVGFLTVGTGLRYDMAIVSAKDNKEADHLLLAALLFSFPTATISTIAMALMIHFNILSYGKLPAWSALAAGVTLLLTGFFTALRYWAVKHDNFQGVSTALVVQGFGRASTTIAMGLSHMGWIGLLAGEIIGRSLGIARLLRFAATNIKTFVWPLDGRLLRSVLSKYWKFPAVVLPSSLLDSLVAMITLPILSSLFGTFVAGQFLLVQNLISLPSALITGSVADVFHSHISEAYRTSRHQMRPILWRITKTLSIISFLIYIPLALVAPFVAGFIFGREWAEAGVMLAILAPISLFGMVVGPVSRLLMVVNRPELKLWVDTVRLVGPNLGLIIMYNKGYGLHQTMVVYSIMSSLSYLLYFWLIWYSTKAYNRK